MRKQLECVADRLTAQDTPERGGVRAISREIGRTASSVSDALRRLVDEGLVTTDHEPLLPELFDAAVQAWRYRPIHVVVSGRSNDSNERQSPSDSPWRRV